MGRSINDKLKIQWLTIFPDINLNKSECKLPEIQVYTRILQTWIELHNYSCGYVKTMHPYVYMYLLFFLECNVSKSDRVDV